MRIARRLSFGAAALVALLGVPAGTALAHEKWFVREPTGGLRWDLLFRPLPLATVGAVLLATLLGVMLWRARGFLPGPEAFGATISIAKSITKSAANNINFFNLPTSCS